MSLLRFGCVLAVFAIAVALRPARADDVEGVRQKLFEAKKAYDGEAQKFRKASAEWFDKREAEAREAGNKKLVDQAKAERAAFEKEGETPQAFPIALHSQMRAARDAINQAYTTAVKDYVRLKADDAAEAIEKEQKKLLVESTLMFGKRTYVGSLRATNVKVWNNVFDKNAKFKVNGDEVSHCIYMHPDAKAAAQANFPLAGRPTLFRATVGIPQHEEGQADSTSALTFEVLGDGVSLWKSKPVAKMNAYEVCTVKIERVKTLTLRVHCPENNNWAHSVWFAPTVVE